MEALALREETGIAKQDGLQALVERFLLSQDVRPSSRNTYKRSLRPFLGWISQQGIARPEREAILGYKRFLGEAGLSSLTVSAYLVVVRKFFSWTDSLSLYPNVAQGIKGSNRSKGFHKDPLTVSQIKDLLQSIDRATLEGKRDYAILNLLVRTGLRTVEAVRADIGDMRQQSGEPVLWIQGKGRDTKDEIVLLTPDALKPIQEYLQARGVVSENLPLFASLSDRNQNERLTTRSISRIAKERLRGIGLVSGRLTAHSLRHTAITLSLLGGASIQEAQALGRHSNINTTLIYAHNINRTSSNAPERRIETLLAGVN